MFQLKTRNLVRKKRFDIDEIPPWQWVLEGFDACVRIACLLPDFGSLKVRLFRKRCCNILRCLTCRLIPCSVTALMVSRFIPWASINSSLTVPFGFKMITTFGNES